MDEPSSPTAGERQHQALVTALTRMGARLTSSLQMLSVIAGLSEVSVKSGGIDGAAQDILDILVRQMEDVQNCSIMLYNSQSGSLELMAGHGALDLLEEEKPGDTQGLSFRPGQGVAGRVYLEGTPCFWDPQSPQADWLEPSPGRPAPASLACLPLSPLQERLGVLNISFVQAKPFDVPRQRDLILLAAAAGNVLQSFLLRLNLDEKAQALARSVQQYQHELEERQRAEQALKESEERLRSLSEAAEEGIIVHDMGVIVDANSAALRMTGYQMEEIRGQNAACLTTEQSWGQLRQVVSSDRVSSLEVEVTRKDGAVFPCHFSGRPFAWQGRQLRVATFRDLTSLKQARQDLAASEEKHRSLLDSLNIGVYRTNWSDGKHLRANLAMAAIFGLRSAAEMVDRSAGDFYQNADDRQALQDELLQKEWVRNRELRLEKADGKPFWASITAALVRDDQGRPQYVDGIIEDISQRKRAEEALAASEERFRSLSQCAPDIIYALDDRGAFTYVNPAWKRLLGHEPAQVLGRYFVDFVDREEARAYARLFKLVRDGLDTVSDLDGALHTAEGAYRYLSMSASPYYDPQGKVIGLVGVMKDIEPRLLSERALRESQARLTQAQKMARLGNWELDLVTGRLELSEQARQVLGLESAPDPLTLKDLLQAVHAQDRALVERVFRQGQWPGGLLNLEHRVSLVSGDYRVAHQLAQVEVDAQGQACRLAGAVQDITQLRRSEEKMRLLARVFENTIEGIVVTDDQGRIQMVNESFSDITGFTQEDALGQNPRILNSGRQDAQFYQQMWQSLLESGSWQGELWNRRKNGEAFPAWLTITAIKDAQGRTANYVGVFHDITERKRAEEHIRHQAYHDALTGLPNRLLFNDRLGVAIAHATRVRQNLAVLFFDLDNFKNVNDSLGHAVGDQLLQSVAKRLVRWVRDEDTVARLGGDEFVMLVQGTEQPDHAVHVAQRILQSLSEPFEVNGRELYVSASVGITMFPHDGADPESLVSGADLAMYRAKEQGRGSYKLFTPAMNARVVQRLSLEGSLRKALERQQFVLHYQPKVELASRQVVGLEALVRWVHPEQGLVSPDFFIPVAEDTGIILPLGQWVLETACRDTKLWHRRGLDHLHVAVNLSPRQFMQKNLAQVVHQVLQDSELPPQALELEITENLVMHSVDEAIQTLNQLASLGVRLSMDDFGRGYSSLYYLKRLPMHALKIDRSFVSDIGNADDAAIVNTIISMSRNLGLKVVAEGVETEEQLAFLQAQRCDMVQGYFFSRPLPRDEITALLASGLKLGG